MSKDEFDFSQLKNVETMELSEEDSKAFIEMLQEPPEPNEALKDAARAYKENIED